MTGDVFKEFNVKQEEFVTAVCTSMLVAFLEMQGRDETIKILRKCSPCLM